MEALTVVISLAIALVFAVLCYRIADRKGHNAVLWGILGFILPLIALIIVLLLRPRRPEGAPGH